MSACPVCGHAPLPDAAYVCPVCGAALGGPELRPGSELRAGRYRVEALLGQGGFGITYRASKGNETVAIKEYFPAGAQRRGNSVVLPAALRDSEQAFLEEGRVLARFSHPGIVRVHEAFEEGGTAYLVMDFLAGEPLGQRLERGPLEERELLEVARQVVDALSAVHAAGLLHQDLKPDNLIALPDGRVVLIDFGAARTFQADKTGNYDRVVTPGYGPLEQYGSQVRRGPYTDVYALAATLYALATGAPPPAAMDRVQGVELLPARKAGARVSARVEKALARGLSLQVSERPPSAQALLELLEGKPAARAVPGALPRPDKGASRTTAPTPAPADPVPDTAVQAGPALTRVRLAAQAILDLERGPARPAPPFDFVCPSCHQGEMREVREAEGCPLCAAPGPETFDPASRRCPCCDAGEMETVEAGGHLGCPLCARGQLRAPDTSGTLRCPACRAAELVNRVPDRRRCPHCREGHLEDRLDEHVRCPNCAVGHLKPYSLTRFLILHEERRRCDHCEAQWEVREAGWKLLSARGRLEDRLGETLSERAWRELSGRGFEGWRCGRCAAEWDALPGGEYRFAWAADSSPLLGRAMLPAAWAKLAYRLAPERGSHACPACNAEFELAAGRMRFLRSPAGFLTHLLDREYEPRVWQGLARGLTQPETDVQCDHCGSEWDDRGEELRLLSPGRGPALFVNGTVFRREALGLLARGKTSGRPGALCRNCRAEWDLEEQGRYRLVRPGQGAGRAGETHTLEGWQQRRLRRRDPRPGLSCRRCHAEWVTVAPDLWELSEAGRSGRRPAGTRLSARDWRLLAGGKQSPGDGYRCEHCGSELTVQPGGRLRQTHPQPGDTRTLEEWKRLGRGEALPGEVERLRREAEAALREAVVSGEWALLDEARIFPRPVYLSERVLFSVRARAARRRNGEFEPNEPGTLWFTSRRVLFDGPAKTTEIPLERLERAEAQGAQLRLRRNDRERALVYFVDGFRAVFSLGAVRVETGVRAPELAELVEGLARGG
ncbi:putative Ser/Thr protein kinase [Deinobacterium chartae]|uniref:Putative Ser/Thr protein kinase n=1 Tax=Deinobacterium chartae TaxID=521158 RepID=A0A841I2N3_9DEIO|nr:serine/threonine-protein kinase [Deinobacterium chartae]MBB6098639.1 putative Ser/Thr protein kinase [Deinobacterium chartae]